MLSLTPCKRLERMKQLFFFIGLLCSMAVQAQDMKALFIALPDSLSPLLTKVNREDFGDFLDSNMKAEVKNRFGKPSEMRALTADYLDLRLSEACRVEMKLLPVNDSVKVICVVHTYMAPAADSRVSFYDTAWKELSAADFLRLPDEEAFYRTPASQEQADSLRNLRMHADMFLLEAALAPNGNTLSFRYATPDYLDKETREQLRPYLVEEQLTYVWHSGRFVKE